MKKIFLFFAVMLVNCSLAQTPGFTMAKQLGGSGLERGWAICTDLSGNILTTGEFQGSCDFDPGSSVYTLTVAFGTPHAYISKLDANGNFIWAKQFTGAVSYGYDIATDQLGNVYTTGLFSGIVDFDPGTSTFTLNSGSGSRSFINKLDANGNFVYAFAINSILNSQGNSITTDQFNNVYAGGGFVGTADFDPGPSTYTLADLSTGGASYILKLDQAGNFIWATTIEGTGGDGLNDLAVDAAGNVFSSGNFSGTCDFDTGPGTFTMAASSFSILETYIAKANSSGNFIWAKKIGNGITVPRGMGVDASSNVFISGTFQNTSDFDPSAATFTMTSLGQDDNFIVKLDASGNFAWARSFGSSWVDGNSAVAIDVSGNAVITGGFTSPVDFDPGPGTFTLSGGSGQAYISILNNSGNFVWAGTYNGVAGGNDISCDANGNIYNTGEYNMALMDFDPGPGIFSMPYSGSGDVFIVKLCTSAPTIPTAINGSTLLCQGSSATYSVPLVLGAGTYVWNLPSGWTGTSSVSVISSTAGTSGIFTVTAINGCGTSPSQTMNVTVNPGPSITSFANPSPICAGQSSTLTANGTANSYTWSTGATTQTTVITPTASAGYTVTGMNSVNGCTAQANTVLNVNPTPTVTITGPTSPICSGSSACLSASGGVTYAWSGPCGMWSTMQNPCFPINGTCGCSFTVVINNSFMCYNTATFCITTNANPTVSAITSTSMLCSGQTSTLTSNGALTYSWSTSATGSTTAVSPTTNTTYSVTGTDGNGCSNTTSITQSVSACTGINQSVNNSTLQLYPNPTSGELTLKTASQENLFIEVYNVIGEMILKQNITETETKINLKEQANGVYFLRAIDKEKTIFHSKIIKQ